MPPTRPWLTAPLALALAACTDPIVLGLLASDGAGPPPADAALDAFAEASTPQRDVARLPGGCDPVAQDCPNGGEHCLLRDLTAPLCASPGAVAEGQRCLRGADCARGLHCAAVAGWEDAAQTRAASYTLNETFLGRGTGACARACYAGDASSCGAGARCVAISRSDTGAYRADYGICSSM